MAEKKISLDLEINKGSSDKSVKSIKTELREAKEEAIALARKFGELSPEATKAAAKLASLKDEMGDLNEKVNGLNPDKFARLATLTNGVVRGFQAASGAAVLFGNTSKDIEKTIAKLQATMALADGIQGVMDARKSFVDLGNQIKGSVVKAFSTLKGSIIATGIGALIIALGLVAANFDEVKKFVLNLFPGLEKLGGFVTGLINGFTDFIGVTTKAGRALEDSVKSQETSLEKLNGWLDRNLDKYDKFTAAKFKADQDYKSKKLELDKQLTEGLNKAEYDQTLKELQAQKQRAVLKADQDRKLENNAIQQKKNDEAKERKAKQDAIKKQQEDDIKKAEQAIYDKYKRSHEAQIKIEEQEEKEREDRIKYRQEGQAQFNKEVEEEAAFQKQIADKTAADKKAALQKELEDLRAIEQQKQELRLASIDNIAAIGNLIGQLAGKNKAFLRIGLLIEQAAAIAKMVINTQAANVAARATGTSLAIPSGGASLIAAEAIVQKNNISTGISIAASIAATAKAMQQLGGGGGGSTPSLGGGGGGGGSIGIQAPSTGFTQIRTPNQNPNNNQQKQPPVKVFVVQKDIQEATIAADRITAKAVVK